MIKLRRVLTVLAAVVAIIGATGAPALAVDDGFYTTSATPSNCPASSWGPNYPAGYLYFVDYGEGDLSNPDKNDDYLLIKDTCADGDGVVAFAWHKGVKKGPKYHGKGYDEYVVWDPFGNVAAGERIGIQVCSQNGSGGTPYDCGSIIYRTSQDG
ncbi:hypothetical protein [Phytohabitans aurantiacus]|jgi:hypothetical protein|uniref:Uncharacterized protein n=1 Tax=Phytohabitans aurantiacus TaxID=3016789 RepID=A0ABQ5R1T1_9ACTN|nr:hypothetical protein [Phytohabitans aurantiacus]GLI00153.1 hypothetical protein Pa4123_54290 [Phytohabitans aurantiacus]